ncbi:MAG: hypothetical protein A3E82_09415 [Gammaproteobacteria bacterium RIFCSPHIGHO2_12_FULL_38_11]|nr:MAG: hypothetical protein A3E82_09415 [Gammaproteobacteria bacterium RIFCSPHIGHO2_12_FULL_38_11]
MRHKENLLALANILASHDRDTIQRTIRSTVFSKIPPEKKQSALQTLRLAETYINANPPLPENWRTSPNCFRDLSNYFITQTTIDDYEEKALCCWYLLLNETLPDDFSFQEIIVMGNAYLPEPHQFAAFIIFLLDKKVSPTSIKQSKLLYHYFQYNIADIASITRTYALIQHGSETTQAFLAQLVNTACLLRGFINHSKQGKYQSYNLMGDTFLHTKPIIHHAQKDENKIFITPYYETYASVLFQLFEFEFIKILLNCDSRDKGIAANIYDILLKSKHKKHFLNEIPLRILTGEINYFHACLLLNSIGSAYSYPLCLDYGPHPDLLAAITENPFYVHIAPEFLLSHQITSEAIYKLCANQHSQTIHHLPFLINLSAKLNNQHLEDLNNKIFDTIYNYLITVGNEFPVACESMITQHCSKLEARFEKKLAMYANNLDTVMNDFLYGKCNYQTIEEMAGEQLNCVNLIKRLFPELLVTLDYPFGYYVLIHRLIEKAFYHPQKNETLVLQQAFPSNVLYTITDDIQRRIRILQECLLLSKNIDFSREIILFSNKQDNEFTACFYHTEFGNKTYAFDFIASQQNGEFREWAFSVIQVSDTEMLNAIKRSIINKSDQTTIHLLQSTQLTELSALNAINYLITEGKTNDHAFIERCILIMPPAVFSKNLITLVTQYAVKMSNQKIVRFVCTALSENKFPEDFVKTTAYALLPSKNWGMIKLMCGLSSEPLNQNPIKKNNIDLLIDVLNLRIGKSTIIEFYQKDIIREAFCVYDKKNTLFHLAANSGCYQTFFNTFSFFEKHLVPESIYDFLYAKNAAGDIPACPLNLCDAKEINEFLNNKKEEYKNKFHFELPDGTPWRRPGNYKRTRVEYSFWSSDSEMSEEKSARIEKNALKGRARNNF